VKLLYAESEKEKDAVHHGQAASSTCQVPSSAAGTLPLGDTVGSDVVESVAALGAAAMGGIDAGAAAGAVGDTTADGIGGELEPQATTSTPTTRMATVRRMGGISGPPD
jgi:hypothetical protein